MNKKMTIFYNLSTLEITTMFEGTQSLEGYKGLCENDASKIFGIIHIDYNEFILKHKRDFELVKTDDGNVKLQLKTQILEEFKKFIK